MLAATKPFPPPKQAEISLGKAEALVLPVGRRARAVLQPQPYVPPISNLSHSKPNQTLRRGSLMLTPNFRKRLFLHQDGFILGMILGATGTPSDGYAGTRTRALREGDSQEQHEQPGLPPRGPALPRPAGLA